MAEFDNMERKGANESTAMNDGAPPSYTASSGQPQMSSNFDVEKSAPPSYDSLFGKAKAIKAESNGNFDFAKKISVFFIGSIGFIILLGVFSAIPIAMIAVGATYLGDCPEEKFIPIWLVVAGSVGLARNVLALVRSCCLRQKDRDGAAQEQEDQKPVNPLDSVIDCFMFAWFIAGNVWVYRTKGDFDSDNPNADNYCNYTVYWFAFWVITSTYILMAASIVCCCACCVCLCCCAKKEEEQ